MITFVAVWIIFQVAVINSSVAKMTKITFAVAEVSFKVAVITYLLVKITIVVA